MNELVYKILLMWGYLSVPNNYDFNLSLKIGTKNFVIENITDFKRFLICILQIINNVSNDKIVQVGGAPPNETNVNVVLNMDSGVYLEVRTMGGDPNLLVNPNLELEKLPNFASCIAINGTKSEVELQLLKISTVNAIINKNPQLMFLNGSNLGMWGVCMAFITMQTSYAQSVTSSDAMAKHNFISETGLHACLVINNIMASVYDKLCTNGPFIKSNNGYMDISNIYIFITY